MERNPVPSDLAERLVQGSCRLPVVPGRAVVAHQLNRVPRCEVPLSEFDIVVFGDCPDREEGPRLPGVVG